MTIRIGATTSSSTTHLNTGMKTGSRISSERTQTKVFTYPEEARQGMFHGYFKAGSGPGRNEYTNLTPYSNIMPESYRMYVKGLE